jgi:hypothetical protein
MAMTDEHVVEAAEVDLSGTEELTAAHIAAYEQVLAALLDVRTTAELRDVFARELTQAGAQEFAKALQETRGRNQPDSFALPWAIEAVISERRSAEGDDISRMFYDTDFHAPPSEETERLFNEMWEVRA